MVAARTRARSCIPALCLGLALGGRAIAAPWIVITEIHFHPPGGAEGEKAGEYFEVLNREAPRSEISRWRIEGDVDFQFPDGVTLNAGEHIVVARDPHKLLELHPDTGRVFGPFSGALDNAGGRLRLINAAGGIACEARWGAKSPWPAAPCGTGHTLSLLDPLFDPLRPESWAPSRRIGGTPGQANFPVEEPSGARLIARGAEWRWAKGLPPPEAGWHERGFDDSSWAVGPSGLGYGDSDDATVVSDMSGRYMALFTRHAFDVKDPRSLDRLVLRADYDDGFVAYLNGSEIARANLGAPGTEISPDQPADARHEAGAPIEIDLGPASEKLVPGRNVLAVEVHNDNLTSSDLSLIVELLSRAPSAAGSARVPPRINEAHAAGPDSFIEIYNAGPAELDLGGTWVTDDPESLRKHAVPNGVRAPPRGLVALTRRELGEGFTLQRSGGFFALTSADGTRVLDAVILEWSGDLASKPRGRTPDGAPELAVLDEPTPGAPNRPRKPSELVVNEILYHAPDGSAGAEFIEIHNRGQAPQPLAGFRLSGAVRIKFPDGASIAPGGHAVIAELPDALASIHGLDRSTIFGPYEGRLSGKSDEVVLRDDWGNAIDRVKYADRSPWPAWADGLGSSLELVDPALDNSLPQAWEASDESSEAAWETFTVTKEHKSFQGRSYSELQLLLLDEGECLIDDVQVSGGALAETFENGSSGWTALGNHEGSEHHRGDAAQGTGSYRIVSDGRGNPRHNYVSRRLPRSLRPSREYTVQLRAKWVRGSPLLLVRTPGQGLAQAFHFRLPGRIGTPGAENSRRARTAPIAMAAPVLEPIAPAPGQPVLVQVKISSSAPVASAEVRYSARDASRWLRVPLTDDGKAPDISGGDGVWTGLLPGVTSDAVSFFAVAKNEAGSEAAFPPGGAARPAMYPVGARRSQKMPTYTLLVPDSQWQAMAGHARMSNRLLAATLVYDDVKIFYDVRFRIRGSPFTRSQRNWRVVFGAENLDGRSTLTLDGQGGDATRPNERLTYWLIDQLHGPTPRQHYVRLRIPGREEGIYEDVEKIDERWSKRWFPPKAATGVGSGVPAGGLLHKVDDHWELSTEGEQSYREADFVHDSEDPEEYRWAFPPRGSSFDLERVAELIRFLDPQSTPNEVFDSEVQSRLDVDEWIRVLAARTIADDWDTMGRTRGKNAFLYLPRGDGTGDGTGDDRWRLIPWDCDLAWQQNPYAPLLTGRFGGIDRLLERPQHWRRYVACLWFLAERSLGPNRLDPVLADLAAAAGSGARSASYRGFATARRQFILSQLPDGPTFRIDSAERIARPDGPDVLRASGSAPPQVVLLGAGGRIGETRLEGEHRWTAEIPIGPEGGARRIQAFDLGRIEVASAQVDVPGRPGAKPLPAPPQVLELSGKGVKTVEPGPAPKASQSGRSEPTPAARLRGNQVKKQVSKQPSPPVQQVRRPPAGPARPEPLPPPADSAWPVIQALALTATAVSLSLLLVWRRRRTGA